MKAISVLFPEQGLLKNDLCLYIFGINMRSRFEVP